MNVARVEPDLQSLSLEEAETILEAHAPNFPKVVDSALENHAVVMMTVQAFHTQPDLLVVALRYASLRGATVQFKPMLAEQESTSASKAA
jgi:hypothetical protein